MLRKGVLGDLLIALVFPLAIPKIAYGLKVKEVRSPSLFPKVPHRLSKPPGFRVLEVRLGGKRGCHFRINVDAAYLGDEGHDASQFDIPWKHAWLCKAFHALSEGVRIGQFPNAVCGPFAYNRIAERLHFGL